MLYVLVEVVVFYFMVVSEYAEWSLLTPTELARRRLRDSDCKGVMLCYLGVVS